MSVTSSQGVATAVISVLLLERSVINSGQQGPDQTSWVTHLRHAQPLASTAAHLEGGHVRVAMARQPCQDSLPPELFPAASRGLTGWWQVLFHAAFPFHFDVLMCPTIRAARRGGLQPGNQLGVLLDASSDEDSSYAQLSQSPCFLQQQNDLGFSMRFHTCNCNYRLVISGYRSLFA